MRSYRGDVTTTRDVGACDRGGGLPVLDSYGRCHGCRSWVGPAATAEARPPRPALNTHAARAFAHAASRGPAPLLSTGHPPALARAHLRPTAVRKPGNRRVKDCHLHLKVRNWANEHSPGRSIRKHAQALPSWPVFRERCTSGISRHCAVRSSVRGSIGNASRRYQAESIDQLSNRT